MKHSFFRDATECLIDEDRTRGFYRAIARMVRPGDTVVDCGTGTGILAVIAVREGAKSVIAIEQDRRMAEIAVENTKSSAHADKIQVAHGDAAAFRGNVDVVIIDLLETLLITGDQVKVTNAFVSKGIINPKVKVLPLMCSSFFEPVHFDFEFYDFHMPQIIQARNPKVTDRYDVLASAVMFNQVSFTDKIEPKVHFEGRHTITQKGFLNALKFSTVTHLTDEIMLGATNYLNIPVYVPVHEMVVKPGDVISVTIDYVMGQGYETLNVNVS